MRLYLAIALLMLAFVAYTEAQDQVQDQDQDPEQTIEQKFAHFGTQMAEVSKNLAEKAKTTFEEIKTSQFVEESRDWFQRQIDSLKAKLA